MFRILDRYILTEVTRGFLIVAGTLLLIVVSLLTPPSAEERWRPFMGGPSR